MTRKDGKSPEKKTLRSLEDIEQLHSEFLLLLQQHPGISSVHVANAVLAWCKNTITHETLASVVKESLMFESARTASIQQRDAQEQGQKKLHLPGGDIQS